MGIVWNEQSARWFREASEYTGYNRELARILLKHIPERTTLCDIGCGSGLIDLELSPFFDKITCVDISEPAVSSLGDMIRDNGIRNIIPLCSDGLRLSGQWDTVMALFHGGSDYIPRYLRFARERLIWIAFTDKKERFGPEGAMTERSFSSDGVEEYLKQHGIKYTVEKHSLEHGQPFRSIREAEAFARDHNESMTEEEAKAYLAGALQETGREDYPYYLPKKKNFALFVIKKYESPDLPDEMRGL